MATSGTVGFNLDIADIIEEAYELAGKELRTGYDMKTARRSLDIMMREWGNRGVNFWTIRENVLPVTAGTQTITLPNDCIDILDANWRYSSGMQQVDRILTRMSMVDWSQLANKNRVGTVTQFWVHRVFPPVITLWSIPSDDGVLLYYDLRSIQDMGDYGNTPDIPPRFIPPMTTGLAYYLAMKDPNTINMMNQRLTVLKQEYDRQFQLASEEDRERTPFKLIPDMHRSRY